MSIRGFHFRKVEHGLRFVRVHGGYPVVVLACVERGLWRGIAKNEKEFRKAFAAGKRMSLSCEVDLEIPDTRVHEP